MGPENVYQTDASKAYPLLVNKAVKKGRTRAGVDELAKGKPMDQILRKDRGR